jgi:hypothetical protein
LLISRDLSTSKDFLRLLSRDFLDTLEPLNPLADSLISPLSPLSSLECDLDDLEDSELNLWDEKSIEFSSLISS